MAYQFSDKQYYAFVEDRVQIWTEGVTYSFHDIVMNMNNTAEFYTFVNARPEVATSTNGPGMSSNWVLLPELPQQGENRFQSLADIVNNYMVLYGDEEANHGRMAMRRKVEAFGMRALAELSYDTLSVKTLETRLTDIPRIVLPRDYVDLVSLNFVNRFGVEQWIVPRKDSGNPRSPLQTEGMDDWNPTTTYTVGQGVQYNGNTFRARRTNINRTPINGNDWIDLGRVGQSLYNQDGEQQIRIDGSVTRDRWDANSPNRSSGSADFGQYATTTGGYYTYGKRYYLDTETVTRAPTYVVNDELGVIDLDPIVLRAANGSIISARTVDPGGAIITMKYISDGISGDPSTIQVHKYAEQAMYDMIYWDMISHKSTVPANEKQRAQRKAYASRRTAKLRMSKLSPREIQQTLRTQARWIRT